MQRALIIKKELCWHCSRDLSKKELKIDTDIPKEVLARDEPWTGHGTYYKTYKVCDCGSLNLMYSYNQGY